MTTVSGREVSSTEPTWEFARLFPPQGQWDEEDYFAIETNQLVEFSHGQLEVLVMPSITHQLIVLALFRLLDRWIEGRQLGKVLVAPTKIQLWPGKYREPDVVLILQQRLRRRTEQYWVGADLAIEIVSPGDRQRDTVTKRREYAQAGIPEYWIVDPEYKTISVLILPPVASELVYTLHGEFHTGEQATSQMLPGFVVDVDELFASAET